MMPRRPTRAEFDTLAKANRLAAVQVDRLENERRGLVRDMARALHDLHAAEKRVEDLELSCAYLTDGRCKSFAECGRLRSDAEHWRNHVAESLHSSGANQMTVHYLDGEDC